MVGFWIRAGKTIVGTKPKVKFKGQSTVETEAYKKSVKKTLNKAKLGRSQERIDAWWKKNKKKFK